MTSLALHRHGKPGALPLVLVPALPLDHRLYDRVVEALPDRDVIVVDLPGFGDSPLPQEVSDAVGWDGGPSLQMVATALVAALDSVGVGRFVVAGTSIGGYVAMRLAETWPERVAGIGLIDTKARADSSEGRADREETARAAEGPAGTDAVAPILDGLLGSGSVAAEPDLPDRVAAIAADAAVEGIAYALRAMAARPDSVAPLTALGEAGVPALVLRGDEDARSTGPEGEDMARALRTEPVELPGVGHLAPIEAPVDVAGHLDALVSAAQASSAEGNVGEGGPDDG
jgi:pimeloyl-ACP methyl ester carboxylesterase